MNDKEERLFKEEVVGATDSFFFFWVEGHCSQKHI